ncbi:MAG: hypothetical protein C0518_01990 [Opitutus sp.]|nr:hypothetical protein [Opitutus sp.]
MSNLPDSQSATEAALATAQASAASGVLAAQAGYLLTQKSLAKDTAVLVLPLLALEAAAIAEGFAAYAATNALAGVATLDAAANAAAGRAYWEITP